VGYRRRVPGTMETSSYYGRASELIRFLPSNTAHPILLTHIRCRCQQHKSIYSNIADRRGESSNSKGPENAEPNRAVLAVRSTARCSHINIHQPSCLFHSFFVHRFYQRCKGSCLPFLFPCIRADSNCGYLDSSSTRPPRRFNFKNLTGALNSSLNSVDVSGLTKGFKSTVQSTRERLGQVEEGEVTE
jgi:hypothetical protein